jgi:hypothetical protein
MNNTNIAMVICYTCVGAAIGFSLSYSSSRNKRMLLRNHEADKQEVRHNIVSSTLSGAIIGCTAVCDPLLCVIYVSIYWLTSD